MNNHLDLDDCVSSEIERLPVCYSKSLVLYLGHNNTSHNYMAFHYLLKMQDNEKCNFRCDQKH